MPNLDRLHSVPEDSGASSCVDKFVRRLHLGPEEAEAAYRGSSMLLAALETAERPELSTAAKAELERRGIDMACVVADETGGATVHNSPELADMATYEQDWTEALNILLSTPRAPQ